MSSNLIERSANGTVATNDKRICGLACTWEPYHLIDDIWEQVLPTAFDETSLSETYACFDHDVKTIMASVPAKDLVLKITKAGLEYDFPVDDSDDDCRRAFTKIRKGYVNTSSLRMRDVVSSYRREGNKKIKTIHKVGKLVDICPVIDAANKKTKSLIRNAEELENVKQEYETFIRMEKLKEIGL